MSTPWRGPFSAWLRFAIQRIFREVAIILWFVWVLYYICSWIRIGFTNKIGTAMAVFIMFCSWIRIGITIYRHRSGGIHLPFAHGSVMAVRQLWPVMTAFQVNSKMHNATACRWDECMLARNFQSLATRVKF